MNSDNRYNTEQHQQYTTQYAAAGLLRELASKPSPAEANFAGHHAPLLDDATLLDADAEGEPDVPTKPPGKKRGRKPIPGNVERRKAQNRVSQVSTSFPVACDSADWLPVVHRGRTEVCSDCPGVTKQD